MARQKHFLVSKVIEPDEPDGPVLWVEIEAVHSGQSQCVAWREVRAPAVWRQGWV